MLTREEADNALLQTAMAKRGIAAVSFPCILRERRAWPKDTAEVVMLTSRAAAEVLIAAWPALSPQPRVAAPAESTAPKLREAGVPVALTAAGGALALAKEVARVFFGRTVLYVHSAKATHRPEHEATLAALRAHVLLATHPLYDVHLPPAARAGWHALAYDKVFFASPSAVENFFVLHAAAPKPAPLAVACLGASTLSAFEAARPADFPHAFSVPVGDADVIAQALS